MLRAVSTIYLECQVPELLFSSRRVVLKVFRVAVHSSSSPGSQTVLMSPRSGGGAAPTAASKEPPVPPVPPAGPGGARAGPGGERAWPLAAALALTASLGGVYFFSSKREPDTEPIPQDPVELDAVGVEAGAEPALAGELPARVEFLVAGGGAAGFAALRALRAALPGARVLLATAEQVPPYLRPPLSKEVWREPLALAADAPSYRQWSGRRRALQLEPREFYAAVADMRAERPRAALLARGWRVARVEPEQRLAELRAGDQRALVHYDQCLLAPGSAPRRLRELRAAAAAGRSLALRTLDDARQLARALTAAECSGEPARVAVLGGGLLGCELAAALASNGARVTLLCRDAAPLSSLLPRHLAREAARALAAAGVHVVTNTELISAEVPSKGVRLTLTNQEPLDASVVVECVGAEPDNSVAKASGLELDPKTGGIVVDACLRAHAGLYVAGDAASFYWREGGAGAAAGGAGQAAAGCGARLAAAHHDHAVRSGRAAAANMAAANMAAANMAAANVAAVEPERAYDYQPMFWTDLGPELGFEAVGVIDSSLPTVSVFADDAVNDLEAAGAVDDLKALDSSDSGPAAAVLPAVVAAAPSGAGGPGEPAGAAPPRALRYSRGVVFYRGPGGRVVGVLMWNIFNRVQLAQQVVVQGEFDDLVEVAKLFTARERDA